MKKFYLSLRAIAKVVIARAKPVAILSKKSLRATFTKHALNEVKMFSVNSGAAISMLFFLGVSAFAAVSDFITYYVIVSSPPGQVTGLTAFNGSQVLLQWLAQGEIGIIK